MRKIPIPDKVSTPARPSYSEGEEVPLKCFLHGHFVTSSNMAFGANKKSDIWKYFLNVRLCAVVVWKRNIWQR